MASPKLSPVGSQFQVNQLRSGSAFQGISFDQEFPDIVALSDGRFIIVYDSQFNAAGTDVDIHAQFVNANGTLVGANATTITAPTGNQIDPAVAARAAGAFTTVWQDFGEVTGTPDPAPDIYFAVTNSAGVNTVNRTPIMNSVALLSSPDIATMADGRQIVVAERTVSGTDHDIVFDVLDADGTQLFAGADFGLATSAATYETFPQVAGGPGQALVVFMDNAGEASSSDFHISARLFNEATNTFATPVQIITDVAGQLERDPDVAYIGGGRYVIVYSQDATNIFARIYNPATGAISPEIAISVEDFEFSPKVAATADGGFIVTWSEFTFSITDVLSIHARRFDPYGIAFGDEFVVNTLTNGIQSRPVVGVSGSNVMTAWHDAASRPGDADPTSIQAQAATAPVFDYDSAHYGDFDNNGRDDILFQNASTGGTQIFTTDTTGVATGLVPLGTLPVGFHIDGTGNFNSTAGDDILLRNNTTNQVAVWVTNGTSVVDFRVLGSTSTLYLNSGIGDFTGDGQTDLLFRNSATGEIASWQVANNALGPAAPQVLGSAPSFYQIVAVADFTGDNQSDILFRNINTGEIAEWQIANNALGPAAPSVVGSTSTSYHVVGTGDFDGNGANDILFRHDTGQVVVWLLNSAGALLGVPLEVGTPVAANLHIDGTGDLNGDGRSDIVFRDQNGLLIEWLMNGASIQTAQAVGAQSQDFAVAAHHFDLI